MSFRSKYRDPIGQPKYAVGDQVGHWTIIRYMGHSDVNKRNTKIMAKPQHWYRCRCSCDTQESRSQQELNDKRRYQACSECREQQS